MTMTPEKIDRIVTLRANAPVALTVDLSTPIGARLAAVPEPLWPQFLGRFLQDSVGRSFEASNTREDGTIGGVRLELGPREAWDVSDLVADVNRETGEIILPPEAVLAGIEFAGLIEALLGGGAPTDDPDA